jgi:hypothetical protein
MARSSRRLAIHRVRVQRALSLHAFASMASGAGLLARSVLEHTVREQGGVGAVEMLGGHLARGDEANAREGEHDTAEEGAKHPRPVRVELGDRPSHRRPSERPHCGGGVPCSGGGRASSKKMAPIVIDESDQKHCHVAHRMR